MAVLNRFAVVPTLGVLATSSILIGSVVAGVCAEAAPKPSPAASTSSEPDSTSASYGDWVLRCVHVNSPTQTCEVQQTLEVNGRGTVAQIAIGRAESKSPLLVSVLLPVNVAFPSSVLMAVDDKDAGPAELDWKQCMPAGCLAQAELKEDGIKHWRTRSGSGQLRFLAANKQTITFAFSFHGFGSAMEALGKYPIAQ